MSQINAIYNANVYLDGNNLLGKAGEFKLPEFEIGQDEYKALGMVGTIEAFAGFEYDSCCWKLRLINRYWIDYDEVSLNPSRNDEPDRGIFLQIVLKGLGGVVGNKVETFLDQGIQGYREREDQAF